MVVGIDLTTDTVLGQYKLVEPDNITYFEVEDNFDFKKYDYIPSTPGVYDPNGFVLKPVPQPITLEERIAYLEALLQSQNNS